MKLERNMWKLSYQQSDIDMTNSNKTLIWQTTTKLLFCCYSNEFFLDIYMNSVKLDFV